MRIVVRKRREDWANPKRFVKPSQPRAVDKDYLGIAPRPRAQPMSLAHDLAWGDLRLQGLSNHVLNSSPSIAA